MTLQLEFGGGMERGSSVPLLHRLCVNVPQVGSYMCEETYDTSNVI